MQGQEQAQMLLEEELLAAKKVLFKDWPGCLMV
jgi:hypothetical protein